MEIRKKINITLKDYFLFNVGLVKKTLISYAIILIVICIAFNGIMNGFKFENIEFWLNSLMFYGIGLGVLCLYFGLIIFMASRKAYLPNKQYYQNMEIIINEIGISQYSEGAESTLTYDQIFKIKESLGAFIVLVNPRQGILIPKKSFSKAEKEQIRILIKK